MARCSATSAGNAESQDFGQLLTSFVKKIYHYGKLIIA